MASKPKQSPTPTLPAASKLPTAVGRKQIAELADALYEMSSLHAQRAIGNIGATAPLELLDQAISIGGSVELLAKSVLAGIDPHLIRDKSAGTDTTLALIGRPRYEHALPQLSTIAAREAIPLIAKLTNTGHTWTGLEQVLSVRNSAIHLGMVDARANDVAIGHLVRLVDRLLAAKSAYDQVGSWADYWGTQEEEARTRLDREIEEVATRYEQALATARRTYQSRWSDTDTLDEVQHLLEGQPPWADDGQDERPHTCPACGSQGWVVYDIERGPVEIDKSGYPCDAAWTVRLTGKPSHFECNVCLLRLDDEDLDLAGITGIELDEVEASEEEVDLWRDSGYLEDDLEY